MGTRSQKFPALFPWLLTVALCSVLLAEHKAHAQTVPANFSGSGVTSFDGWVNMNSANFSDYGGFPGSSPWPAPVESNASGSGDAQLQRVAGAQGGGGPFFSSESLYFGSFVQVANALGGTLRVSEPTPVSGVKTVTLQVQIGEAIGYGFVQPSGAPLLKINGGTTTHAPAYSKVVNIYQNGVFDSPETGEEPVYVKTWAYQWNVGNLGNITSIQIDFSAVTHAQIYEVRLDQSDVAQSRSVFIPAFLTMTVMGIPQYDGTSTSVTHGFAGPPSSILTVEYSESVGQSPWVASAPVETGAGSFDVTFTTPGDRRAAWSRNMFFRARYPSDL